VIGEERDEVDDGVLEESESNEKREEVVDSLSESELSSTSEEGEPYVAEISADTGNIFTNEGSLMALATTVGLLLRRTSTFVGTPTAATVASIFVILVQVLEMNFTSSEFSAFSPELAVQTGSVPFPSALGPTVTDVAVTKKCISFPPSASNHSCQGIDDPSHEMRKGGGGRVPGTKAKVKGCFGGKRGSRAVRRPYLRKLMVEKW
jgi:hypothetical protein